MSSLHLLTESSPWSLDRQPCSPRNRYPFRAIASSTHSSCHCQWPAPHVGQWSGRACLREGLCRAIEEVPTGKNIMPVGHISDCIKKKWHTWLYINILGTLATDNMPHTPPHRHSVNHKEHLHSFISLDKQFQPSLRVALPETVVLYLSCLGIPPVFWDTHSLESAPTGMRLCPRKVAPLSWVSY